MNNTNGRKILGGLILVAGMAMLGVAMWKLNSVVGYVGGGVLWILIGGVLMSDGDKKS